MIAATPGAYRQAIELPFGQPRGTIALGWPPDRRCPGDRSPRTSDERIAVSMFGLSEPVFPVFTAAVAAGTHRPGNPFRTRSGAHDTIPVVSERNEVEP
ncbi:Uncharacterised protein [Nocardia cyriacigeorgica]|uniref:Uncharacterized protein n=1 Tax=Nocardia cyriacigeorgica TaxID=135487 RepID=A0A4U8W1L6_9NOCA|nr:Uncharacterised protein [Nocardia cyriacigeorgica]